MKMPGLKGYLQALNKKSHQHVFLDKDPLAGFPFSALGATKQTNLAQAAGEKRSAARASRMRWISTTR